MARESNPHLINPAEQTTVRERAAPGFEPYPDPPTPQPTVLPTELIRPLKVLIQVPTIVI